ncbi:MAG: hypothetical protein HYR73_02995 [Candidatus Eisenbacteria bacterium]|nr:hypothetical protein [Candidatus Eisenbacteria bacterium]
METHDIVIGRGGDSLLGRVLDPRFTILSSFGSVTVETKRIQWIHFRNPPQQAQDEMWCNESDRLSGELQGHEVKFKPVSGATMTIPYTAVHTLIVNQFMNPGLRL